MSYVITGEDLARPEEIESQLLSGAGDATRYHYMDNLRAIAMIAGIFFHAALAYSPLMQNLWLSADAQNSEVFDLVAWFSHLFRMPLFFLISGFFAMMLIEKRGTVGFLKNRFLRIGLPFVIFLPLIIVSFIGLIGFALDSVEAKSPILQLIAATYNNPDIPKPPFSTTHLWFLFNLLQFGLVVAVLHRFNFIQSTVTKIATSMPFLLIAMPLLLVPALYSQALPNPAPERIYPELWSYGFYGVFFLVGVAFFKQEPVLDSLRRYTWFFLGASLLAYPFVYYALPESLTIMDMLPKPNQGFSWSHLMIAVLEALIAVYMTLFCLIVGKSLLNRENGFMRLISNSSYWVYIIHLPVLFYIQFLLMDVNWSSGVEFLVSSFGTFATGLSSYILLVRWTPIGWLLNGRKKA